MDSINKTDYMIPTSANDYYQICIDYPPAYNEYGKQLLERDLDNAISCIFRSLYGSKSTLPEIPGLFVDMERFTHILDKLENRMLINRAVNETLYRIVPEFAPEITVDYDPITQMMTYNISLKGQPMLKVEQKDSLDSAEVIYMNKKFYE